ncbi:ribosome small subunit-dependent GTPase A [Sphingomonas glaciei]|uniref:Small ribosomal subunit biogenesis GTPase RsgA n=1 Tax=Sphingomonas glaciei TaxID=2938948 RepID=A0ABY5MYS0_9SPHN|nr:ribosome small subunit-dependent GTPase A [Sphingomonas glaciei]UUR08462.1 ribosome small subunit-dependent GTPase A [Sphingomonas glaciei]
MTNTPGTPILFELGWNSFFGDQLSEDDGRGGQPVRVMSVHRGMVSVAGDGFQDSISSSVPDSKGSEDRPTVGDWLLIDRDDHGILRILDRTSLFKRPAPGDDRRLQLIAANVDTLFVVTSCDQDFNVARLERYLVLAGEVGVSPVIVLTKADLSPDPSAFVEAAQSLQAGVEVRLVNARSAESVAGLADYCRIGATVALVGSSGVGKSTLVNTLTGSDATATQPVREEDGKGMHTTTVRQMHRIGFGATGGGWLIDTPGMREIQMSEVSGGVAEVFDDIVAIALQCRFTNCMHNDEPQCAIRAASAAGTLDPARLARWRKLAGEDEVNSGIAARRRARPRKTRERG